MQFPVNWVKLWRDNIPLSLYARPLYNFFKKQHETIKCRVLHYVCQSCNWKKKNNLYFYHSIYDKLQKKNNISKIFLCAGYLIMKTNLFLFL
jgi:hypothetical protein